MLSREDMLRELELLPIWRLREPVQQANAKVSMPTTEVVEATAEAKQAPDASVDTPSFRLIVSDDKQWAFVLAPEHSAEAETLLQNMLKAVSVKVGQNITDANTTHLNQYAVKVIVVMGELEAQHLLSEPQALEALRGEAHRYEIISNEKIPTIVTYAPSHLLKNLHDKAKAWEDLCLAKFTIASL